jgi:hypothetical protein
MVAPAKPRNPLFALGQLCATPGALAALERSGETPLPFLSRHATGDWGNVDDHDRQVNEVAVRDGNAILSSYKTRLDEVIWIITEADRSISTVLLPSEY